MDPKIYNKFWKRGKKDIDHAIFYRSSVICQISNIMVYFMYTERPFVRLQKGSSNGEEELRSFTTLKRQSKQPSTLILYLIYYILTPPPEVR